MPEIFGEGGPGFVVFFKMFQEEDPRFDRLQAQRDIRNGARIFFRQALELRKGSLAQELIAQGHPDAVQTLGIFGRDPVAEVKQGPDMGESGMLPKRVGGRALDVRVRSRSPANAISSWLAFQAPVSERTRIT